MANFIGLGKDCVEFAKVCVSNNNKKDVALFVMAQDKVLHEGMIKDRVEQQNKAETQVAQPQNDSSSRRQKALERLKAHL